jgi:alanine racemase
MAEELQEYRFSQTVFSLEYAKKLHDYAAKADVFVRVHLKLDTGMSRLGFDCRDDDYNEIYDILKTVSLKGIIFEGIFTHFAVSDSNEKDDIAFTKLQYKRFCTVLEKLHEQGFEPAFKHCNNSAATLNYGFKSDLCRVGISLYGLDPEGKRPIKGLKPVMSFKSVISFVKKIKKGDCVSYGRTFIAQEDMTVATVSAGYADGYPRLASNKASVLINGKEAKVIGRVCMDQFVVDVTGTNVKTDDEVVLFGTDLPVENLANCADTINYEIICGISKRVPRIPK